MKRFMDYQPTDAELHQMFDGDLKMYLEAFEKNPGGDFEKRCIARLFFLRGQEDECEKLLETIEDDEYRWECLHEQLPLWGKWKRGAM